MSKTKTVYRVRNSLGSFQTSFMRLEDAQAACKKDWRFKERYGERSTIEKVTTIIERIK